MLGPYEWAQTVRILWNLARFSREMNYFAAPLQKIPAELCSFAANGKFDYAEENHPHFRATFPLDESATPLKNRPTVLFSGGGGDDGTGYYLLARHWASHGFVVLQPKHADAYTRHFDATGHFLPAQRRTTWDVWGLALCEPRPWRARCEDMSSLLDEVGDFDGRVDTSRIGVGGYSFGGHVACLLGGVRFRARGESFIARDKRIKAIINLSSEGGVLAQPKNVWRSLEVPMLLLTGERDKTVWGEDYRAKMREVKCAPQSLIETRVIPGANHFSFVGRLFEVIEDISKIHPADIAAQTVIFSIVKGATTKYWCEQLGATTISLTRREELCLL